MIGDTKREVGSSHFYDHGLASSEVGDDPARRPESRLELLPRYSVQSVHYHRQLLRNEPSEVAVAMPGTEGPDIRDVDSTNATLAE